MKKIIGGVVYNTAKCEILCKCTRRAYNNLPSAYMYLLRAPNGKILEHCDSTGQDCHITSYLELVDPCQDDGFGGMLIDKYEPDEDEIARLVELGIIKEA